MSETKVNVGGIIQTDSTVVQIEKKLQRVYDDIVNIGLHFFLMDVRPYAASCSEA